MHVTMSARTITSADPVSYEYSIRLPPRLGRVFFTPSYLPRWDSRCDLNHSGRSHAQYIIFFPSRFLHASDTSHRYCRLLRRVVRMPRAMPERVRRRVPRRVSMLPQRAVQCEYSIVFGVDVVIGGGDDGNDAGLRTAHEGHDAVSSIQVGGNGR